LIDIKILFVTHLLLSIVSRVCSGGGVGVYGSFDMVYAL